MSDKVTIIAASHPFKDEWLEPCILDHGQTLRQIVGEKAQVQAWIDGVEVPCELLDSTVPDAGSEVIVRPVPADGDVWRSVLQVVVTIVAAIVTWYVGGWGGAVAGAAVGGIGNYAVYTLIPPQPPESFDFSGGKNRLTSITGTRNQLGAFTNIPRLYGTYRLFPPVPMTATPYTEVVGSDQYLRMFLCLGYGPLEIGGLRAGDGSRITHNDTLPDGTIRIGDSDIGLFEDVEYEIAAAEDITTFTDSITEDSFAVSLNTDGESATRTTGPNCKEASIDIVYPQGLYNVSDGGNIRDSSVTWSLQYRAAGTLDEWSFISGVTHGFHHGPVRYGFRWEFPTAGQWEVRLTRSSTYNSRDTHYNDATWTTLRTVENTKPFDVPGTVCMALRIKATDQLSGPLETVNVLASSLLQVHNGSAWVEQATSNPAWVYADIFAGTANAEAIPRTDISTSHLLNWANRCDTLGLEYNGVFDSNTTVFEAARQVASTGRAAWNLTDDAKISVVTDDPAATPKMVISPRNSWDLSSTVAFPRIPHALRVQYVDAETWEDSERLVFDDGYSRATATRYETYQTKGVTSRDQAWKEGRYHLAQARLRPETFSFMQDVQHLRYRRGDLLNLNHDVILVGFGAGRVKSISGNDLTVDEFFEPETGTSYGIKLQKQDGSISVYTLASLTDNVLTLNETPTGVSVGDHFVFGEAGKETIDVKVSKIEPQGDFAARITCVPAAPNIHDADTGAIPPYNPSVTAPKDPPTPTIIEVRSDETVLEPDSDGSLKLGMSVMWRVTGSSVQNYGVELRLRPTSTAAAWRTITVTSPQNKTYFVQGVFTGIEYEIQVRTTYQGRFSAWSTSVTHTVSGISAPSGRPAPTGLFMVGGGQVFNSRDVSFMWDAVTAVWFRRYKVEILSGGVSKRVEFVSDPEYTYTYDKNSADGLTRDIEIRVWVEDVFGVLSSTFTSLTVNNPQAGQVQNATIDAGYLGATVKWDAVSDGDVAGYEILLSTDGASYGVAGRVGAGTTSATFNALPSGAIYAKVGAYDLFGVSGITYSVAAVGSVDGEAPATDPEEFKKEATETFNVPILHGYSFTAGVSSFSWNAHDLYHNGLKYQIPAGSTTSKYVWWDVASPGAYQSGATRPSLDQSAGQFHIAVYYGSGDWDLVWHAAPNQVIGSGYIQRASIGTAQIDVIDASVANITNIWADKIKVGGSPVDAGNLASANSADWSTQVSGAGKPDNNADVTGSNTSYDTARVAGESATTVKNNAAAGATFTSADAGAMAYEDLVESAKLGSTIISGGFIRADLLTADNIVAGTLTGRTVQTGTSGARFVVSSSDNHAKWFDSNNNELCTIGIKNLTTDFYIGSFGTSSASAIAIRALSNSAGIYARSYNSDGIRAYGNNGRGIYAKSESISLSDAAVYAESSTTYGIIGKTLKSGSAGILGTNYSGTGPGIHGVGNASSSSRGIKGTGYYGGEFSGTATGLVSTGNTYYGVWGSGPDYAFYAGGTGGTYGPFTGAHDGVVPDGEQIEPGDIVVEAGIINKATISDVIGFNTLSSIPKQKSVFGVFINKRKPRSNPKTVTTTETDDNGNEIEVSQKQQGTTEKLIGELNAATTYEEFMDVIRGTDGLPSAIRERKFEPLDDVIFGPVRDYFVSLLQTHSLAVINSVGEGCVNVVAEGGDIETGDYICSSSTPGKGMRQNLDDGSADSTLRNYTVAKAREDVTWTQEEIDSNTVKMIACTYHCG